MNRRSFLTVLLGTTTMAIHGFKDRDIAVLLKQVAKERRYTAKPLILEKPTRTYNKGRTRIITVQLTGDLAAGGTQSADICDDSGTPTTGSVTVSDSPQGILTGKKLANLTYLRVYKGDDGDYRIVATLACAVPA